MAKNIDFQKLAELLKEINEQFSELKDSDLKKDPLQLELLEATSSYFTANIAVYRRSIEQGLDPEQLVASFGDVDPSQSVLDSKEEFLTTVSDEEDQVETPEEPTFDLESNEEIHLESEFPSLVEDWEAKQVSDLKENPSNFEFEKIKFVSPSDFQSTEFIKPEEKSSQEILKEIDLIEDVIKHVELDEPVQKIETSRLNDISVTESLRHVNPPIPSSQVDSFSSTSPSSSTSIENESSRPLSINEIIANQQKQSILAKPEVSDFNKIMDLKTSISLNDKLLFIKDLFNGYSLAYSEAIEILNRFEDFASADAFLQANYYLKNNWNSKSETVEKFYIILHKRYNK